MTSAAGLGARIDARRNLAAVSGEADLSTLVEDGDFLNPRLGADRVDDLMGLVAAVVQHAIARAAFDRIGDSVARRVGRFLEVLAVKLDDLVAEGRENQGHAANQTQGQL